MSTIYCESSSASASTGGGKTSPSTPMSLALRVALGVNALAAATGLAIKFGEAATTADPQFPSVFGRVANELCYFTIQSNIIVVVAVCIALAYVSVLVTIAVLTAAAGALAVGAVSLDWRLAKRYSIVPYTPAVL